MSQISFTTAKALKDAGFPRRDYAPGQWYYDADGLSCCVIKTSTPVPFDLRLKPVDVYSPPFGVWMGGTYAPSIEDITTHLPEGFVLEMWDGRYSCKIDTNENLIRTQADSFAEAAALCYLAINETPSKTFVKPGAPCE